MTSISTAGKAHAVNDPNGFDLVIPAKRSTSRNPAIARLQQPPGFPPSQGDANQNFFAAPGN